MEHKARTPNRTASRIAIAVMLFALLAMGVRLLPDDPSPSRAAEANQVLPRLVEGAHYAPGLPPPGAVRRAPAVSVLPPKHPDRKLLDAIRMKEGWKGDSEAGPDGEYGPYQITRDWYLDACKAAGVVPDLLGWQWPEIAFDRHKVEFLMVHYWMFWLGPDADDYRKAKCHRGGPEDGQDIRAHVYAREVLNIKLAMGGD